MFEEMDIGYGQPSISFLVWSVLVSFLTYKLTRWYWRRRQRVALFDKIPSRKEVHWFWGHIHEHPGPGQVGIDFQMEYCRQFPRIHKFWFGKVDCVVVVHHPDTMRQILNASAELVPKTRGPGTVYEVGIKWLGEGLLIANGQRWARNRKLLTPAFHYDVLQPYLGIINQRTDILLDKLAGCAASKTDFDVFQQVCLCSLDIIATCAFSYQSNCQAQGEENPYVQAVLRLQDLWVNRTLDPRLIFDWFYFNFTSDGREFVRLCHLVHKVAEDIIRKRRETLEREGLPLKEETEDKKRSLDFLDIILTAKDEEGKGLTDTEIRDEVDTFLFEGHDTTTSATSFLLVELAKHPDIQERCRQEVDGILGNRENDYVEWKDLNKLPYLTQCIKEALRLHPPVFFISRQNAEPMTVDGYNIPAKTNIGLNIYNLHHNPVVWGSDAEEFKPDRFSSENVAKMHPFQFIPFSAGARNCIGQHFAMNEIKVIAARTLRRYKLTLKGDHEIRQRMGIVLRVENGVMLTVEQRTDMP